MNTEGTQGEISVVEHEGVKCILKSPRRGILNLFSRWELNREASIYEQLTGISGIPKYMGKSSQGILLTVIEGTPMSEMGQGEVTKEFLGQLESIVAKFHSRGIVHSDLKKRSNVIVTPEGSPVVIDFGAAFTQGHILYNTFRLIDLAALAKLRNYHHPGTLTDNQQYILNHPTWAEKLSRFLIRNVRDPWRKITRPGKK